MSRRFTGRAASLALVCLLAGRGARGQEAPGQEPAAVIEKVEIRQNQFLPKETLLFYVSSKAGDRFEPLSVSR